MPLDDADFDFAQFTGRVRLFPLPNLVMFPHVLQPLHVFEPRYRALADEALAGDKLIAMALLAPGWEDDYEGRPKLLPHACLGRVVTHQQLDGGRYNLLLAGLKRVRIVEELPPDKPFREAVVELLDDLYDDDDLGERRETQRQLLDAFKQVLPNMPDVRQQLEELLSSDVSLGMLTDLVAYALQLPIDVKAALLGEPNVDARCRALLRRLHEPDAKLGAPSTAARPLKWPPDFSEN